MGWTHDPIWLKTLWKGKTVFKTCRQKQNLFSPPCSLALYQSTAERWKNVLRNGCPHPTRTKKALMLPNHINIKRQSTSYFQDAQFCWAQIHQLWDAFVLILKCFWMNFENHLLSVGFCRLGVVNKRVLLQLITICSCTCGEDEVSF